MSFPSLRAPDSDDDSEGITEILQPVVAKPAPAKTNIKLQPITPETYAANETVIKGALRSQQADIFVKYPVNTTAVHGTRFSTPSPIKVFTHPEHVGGGQVQLEFDEQDFPAGFVDFHDEAGNRWKCVALWTGEKLIYISNMQAEIALCGKLYAGSTAGGKVRWDKAVVPLNMIPGKFDKFVVSDRVLFDRRKKQWPAQLQEIQQQCNIVPVLPSEELKLPAHGTKRAMSDDDTDDFVEEKPSVKRKRSAPKEKEPKEPKDRKEPKEPKDRKDRKDRKEPKDPRERKEPKESKESKEPKEPKHLKIIFGNAADTASYTLVQPPGSVITLFEVEGTTTTNVFSWGSKKKL